MIIINMLDWDLTYGELADWSAATGADVHVIHDGTGRDAFRCAFISQEDMVAFRLSFGIRPKHYLQHISV